MTDLRIASPCHASWEGMTPNDGGRHCARCAKTVVDVTAMSPEAGRSFVAKELPARLARGERVCVRAHADTRGRLLKPGVRRYLLTNGLAAVLAMTMAGCGGEPPTVRGGAGPTPSAQPAPPTPAPPEPFMGKPAQPDPSPMMGIMAPPIRGDVGPGVAPEPAPAAGHAHLVGEVEQPALAPSTGMMGSPVPLPMIQGDVTIPAPAR